MSILVLVSPISDTKYFMWEYETFSLCFYFLLPPGRVDTDIA